MAVEGMMTFYDKQGNPIAYVEDGNTLYAFNGKPLGHFQGESLYSFAGKHLGRLQDGWIRDNRGDCFLFNELTHDGPAIPARKAVPAKGARWATQAKGALQTEPAVPAKSVSWSRHTVDTFFS
jgi:hypothetical protein